MQIDGFTVVAQLINFLVLVWLLKRFLYGPIVQAMTARQQKIAATLNEARQKAEQAEVEAQKYRTQCLELDAQREAWLEQAQQEIATQREEWLTQVRCEIDAQREAWLAAWQRERTENRHALQQEATRRLTDAVRHALRELADADLEQRMLEPLLTQLRALDASERATLAQAALGGCTISTAFPLDIALQQRCQTALSEQLGTGITWTFHQDPKVACGIILEMPGHRLAWTLDSYLDGFSDALAKTLRLPAAHASDSVI
ncbi:MAG: F0F1 ATP synthase subunit delta [Gammaproteobacteria bacterium]|nr:F0F1 ATP synthase subunit delta [Gammaproteobacteria bacterium]MCP5195374.1 F0F1 ATP synthase subunit delta [Gammaproteobacteria bacterium]